MQGFDLQALPNDLFLTKTNKELSEVIENEGNLFTVNNLPEITELITGISMLILSLTACQYQVSLNILNQARQDMNI